MYNVYSKQPQSPAAVSSKKDCIHRLAKYSPRAAPSQMRLVCQILPTCVLVSPLTSPKTASGTCITNVREWGLQIFYILCY